MRRTPRRCASRGATGARARPSRESDGRRVIGEDPHPRPSEGPAAMDADGQRGAGAIAGALGGSDHACVDEAVWVCDRVTGPAQPLLEVASRPRELVGQRLVTERRQVRVGARVRADLPARVRERRDLGPRQRQQLGRVLAYVPIDALPCHRCIAADPVSRYEQGAWKTEAREQREGTLADRAVTVVEGHGDRPSRRPREGGLAERRAAVAALEHVAELSLETVDRDRARRRPGVADPVVAENEGVPDCSSRHESIAGGPPGIK